MDECISLILDPLECTSYLALDFDARVEPLSEVYSDVLTPWIITDWMQLLLYWSHCSVSYFVSCLLLTYTMFK